jgi:hypothetical protein
VPNPEFGPGEKRTIRIIKLYRGHYLKAKA